VHSTSHNVAVDDWRDQVSPDFVSVRFANALWMVSGPRPNRASREPLPCRYGASANITEGAVQALQAALGADAVVTDDAALASVAWDGLGTERGFDASRPALPIAII